MKAETKKVVRHICLFLFIIYVLVLAYFVFLSDGYGRVDGYSDYRYNLTPFTEIKRFIIYSGQVGIIKSTINLLGNVAAFVPFGALIRWVRNKKTGFFTATVYTFLFSLCIECVQLVTRVGVFDVDDLILNTLGGMIGYLFYYILARYDKKKRKRKKN